MGRTVYLSTLDHEDQPNVGKYTMDAILDLFCPIIDPKLDFGWSQRENPNLDLQRGAN